MSKFINMDDELVINIDQIESIKRVLYSVDEKEFIGVSMDTNDEVGLEYRSFTLATIHLKSGNSVVAKTFIYSDEDYTIQIEESWKKLVGCLSTHFIQL